MEELIKWLESEQKVLEANRKPSPYDAGYYGAIVNTLDFIQGMEVYTEALDNK